MSADVSWSEFTKVVQLTQEVSPVSTGTILNVTNGEAELVPEPPVELGPAAAPVCSLRLFPADENKSLIPQDARLKMSTMALSRAREVPHVVSG